MFQSRTRRQPDAPEPTPPPSPLQLWADHLAGLVEQLRGVAVAFNGLAAGVPDEPDPTKRAEVLLALWKRLCGDKLPCSTDTAVVQGNLLSLGLQSGAYPAGNGLGSILGQVLRSLTRALEQGGQVEGVVARSTVPAEALTQWQPSTQAYLVEACNVGLLPQGHPLRDAVPVEDLVEVRERHFAVLGPAGAPLWFTERVRQLTREWSAADRRKAQEAREARERMDAQSARLERDQRSWEEQEIGQLKARVEVLEREKAERLIAEAAGA